MRYSILYFSLFLSLFISSCGGDDKKADLTAIGGKVYGGEFRFMSSEKIVS